MMIMMPKQVASIPSSLYPFFDDFMGDCFEVVGPSDPGKEIDEGTSKVELPVS
jgi:hypothetical protein